jgi:serine palmitoyltransferase
LIFFFFSFTGEKIKTINLGSYNYLGFANNNGQIVENVITSIKTGGVATASSTQEFGKYIYIYTEILILLYVTKHFN